MRTTPILAVGCLLLAATLPAPAQALTFGCHPIHDLEECYLGPSPILLHKAEWNAAETQIQVRALLVYGTEFSALDLPPAHFTIENLGYGTYRSEVVPAPVRDALERVGSATKIGATLHYNDDRVAADRLYVYVMCAERDGTPFLCSNPLPATRASETWPSCDNNQRPDPTAVPPEAFQAVDWVESCIYPPPIGL